MQDVYVKEKETREWNEGGGINRTYRKRNENEKGGTWVTPSSPRPVHTIFNVPQHRILSVTRAMCY